MTGTTDKICRLDRATNLSLAALAHCVDGKPVALYQAIDLIGCRYTEEDKKLCQLTNTQLVDAIQVTPTEMEAYSRDNSGFARDLAALDSNTFSSDAAKSAFSKALDLLKTAEAHRPAKLELAGGRGEKSALDQLPECLAYCPALQSLDLDDTEVSDLTPLAALIANGLEITGVDPAL